MDEFAPDEFIQSDDALDRDKPRPVRYLRARSVGREAVIGVRDWVEDLPGMKESLALHIKEWIPPKE